MGMAFWLAVITALGALEASAHLTSWPIPTCEELVGYLRCPLARLVAVALWLYAGWHLLSH